MGPGDVCRFTRRVGLISPDRLRFPPGPGANLFLFGTFPAIGCAVGLILVLALSIRGEAHAATPPNIVFILADDLGYGDLSCFGQQRFKTPYLDRLAARGVRLTQHYAGSTVCAPSRCALMTGLHTGHCEVRGNQEHGDEGQAAMTGDAAMLPMLLREAGYATGCFGKWGLGYPGSQSVPLASGFDRFFGYNCQRHAHRYYTNFLRRDSERIDIDPSVYTHDLIFDAALDFVRENHDRPFFCFLPVTIPHAAMEAPEEAMTRWRERFPEFNGTIGKYAGAETDNPVAAFAAMVTRLDSDVGRLVALLEELGVADDTLIVFTSDNGPHVEGGHNAEFFDSNGPLRGFKRDLYEGGIRVPAIASWPSRIAPGGDDDLLSAGWDWLPTLCEAALTTPPEGIDGVSLMPALTGAGEQASRPYLYWEFHEQGGKQAIRVGEWKAVRLNVARAPRGPLELYNLATDPGEADDLADSEPQIVAELSALIDAARAPSDRFAFGR